jgi:hypothetical protein
LFSLKQLNRKDREDRKEIFLRGLRGSNSSLSLIETIATDQLPAAFRAWFEIAIRVMIPARRHIAVWTTMPVWKMKVFRIKRYFRKGCSIRVFNGRIPLTGHDGYIRHFLTTTPANSHYFSQGRIKMPRIPQISRIRKAFKPV